MDIAESALIIIAIVLMFISVLLSVVPFLPGPMLVWGIGIAFGIIEGFDRLHFVAAIVMTLVMIIGSIDDFWLPIFGVKTGRQSCMGALGAFVGAILGSFFIPIPLFGTLIGMILGGAIIELMRVGELRAGIQAGYSAFQMFLAGMIVELSASIIIFVIFVASIWLTR